MDWQVESGSRTSIFLSGTSSDLGDCRRLVADVLHQSGIFPIVQDYFGPDHRTIEDMILHKILASDAVVCLIGYSFGASPISNSDIERSYTQMEFDIASHYEKPIYLFVASEEFALNNPSNQSIPLRIKQEEYRNVILSGSRKYQFFNSIQDLERQIYALVQPLLNHAGRSSIKYEHITPSPACFVGRTNEMIELNNSLDMKNPAVIILIGMGGQGKSTLVAQTLKARTSLPFAAGIWVSAERGGFTFSEFLDCALETFMGSRFKKTDFPRVDTRVRKLIELLQSKPLLIVIDAMERWLSGWGGDRPLQGVYDMSQRQEIYEGLDDFLKETTGLENGSHIIITSRVLPAALDSVNCAILPVLPKGSLERGLPALSQEAAIELLTRLGVLAPIEKLDQIARTLVNHPLALTGFAQAASHIGDKWESLLFGKGTDPSQVFHRLLDETRKHLPDRGRSEQLLKIASLVPEGATLSALEWVIKTDTLFNSSLQTDLLSQVLALADWNLLIWDSNTNSVRLHALVAEYFAELLELSEQNNVHRLISKWYESKAMEAGMTDEGASNRIFAVRHLISAKDSQQAMFLIFESDAGNPNLVDWLSFNGHFWECAELLQSIQNIAEDLEQVTCILTRAKILHELELSHLTLPDLRHALKIILAQDTKATPFLQVLLAQCYGLQGLIHLETSKASEALLLLDKSVLLFESLGKITNDYVIDLAKTLANRGLARWCCGDWTEANQDYSRSIALLEKSGRLGQPDIMLMVEELHARQATINLDRGDADKAVSELVNIVNSLKAIQESTKGRPTKNYFMAHVSLASAYILAKKPSKALEVLKDVIIPLNDMAIQGRWEYNSILAQAHVNATNALLLLERIEEAKDSSYRAVCIFEDVIEKGANQFKGPLAHALFRRSEALIRSKEESGGLNELRRALEISREWLRDWFGESLIEKVFLGNAIQAISFLPPGNKQEKNEIILLIQYLIERLESSSRQSEAILVTKKIISFNWLTLKSASESMDIQWPENCPFDY